MEAGCHVLTAPHVELAANEQRQTAIEAQSLPQSADQPLKFVVGSCCMDIGSSTSCHYCLHDYNSLASDLSRKNTAS